jgi:2-iminoacetate synthase ThiH
VTFVIDSNPNYTNVCITDCQFCAFYRKPGDRRRDTLTVEQVLEKVEFAAEKGATTVLLQGGHNPACPSTTTSTSCARRGGASPRSPRTSSPRPRSRPWPR